MIVGNYDINFLSQLTREEDARELGEVYGEDFEKAWEDVVKEGSSLTTSNASDNDALDLLELQF